MPIRFRAGASPPFSKDVLPHDVQGKELYPAVIYIFVVNVLIIPVYTVGFAYVRFNNTDVFDAQFVSNIILLMYLFRTVCSILKKYLLIKDNKKTLKSPEKNKINQESAKTGHFDSKRINQCYPEKTVQLSPYLNFEL